MQLRQPDDGGTLRGARHDRMKSTREKQYTGVLMMFAVACGGPGPSAGGPSLPFQ